MPNYRNKKTGEIKRFPSVRISWDADMGNQKEKTMVAIHGLEQWENILDTYDFVDSEGEFNVKMKKANTDGRGMR